MSAPDTARSCPYQARRCGGCTRLSVPYAEQLTRKRRQLEKLFDRVMPVEGMAEPWHYRNKVIAAVAHDREGLLTGQYVYGTHYVLRQDDCLLENAVASRIVRCSRDILNAARVPAWDEDRRTGLLRYIQVRYAARTDQALVTWVTARPDFPEGPGLARALMAREPAVRGVVQNINPRPGSAVLGFEERLLAGAPVIDDEMCGLKVRLSSRAFYQVNTVQAEKLYRRALALAELRDDDTVIDAYCGLGLMGMLAARRAHAVVGVEQNPSAVRLADRLARENGLANIRFERGDAAAVLRSRRLTGDVVLVDPPRSGLGPAMLNALRRLAPPRIVYVSCNPVTCAADIRPLLLDGYRLSPVWPFDLFPHTDHIELVVLMSRSGS